MREPREYLMWGRIYSLPLRTYLGCPENRFKVVDCRPMSERRRVKGRHETLVVSHHSRQLNLSTRRIRVGYDKKCTELWIRRKTVDVDERAAISKPARKGVDQRYAVNVLKIILERRQSACFVSWPLSLTNEEPESTIQHEIFGTRQRKSKPTAQFRQWQQ